MIGPTETWKTRLIWEGSLHTTFPILAILTSLSFLVWVYLLLARGSYWRVDQCLNKDPSLLANDAIPWPSVSAVIPARNEADLLSKTLPSLLALDYRRPFHIFLVDDQSTDTTAEAARQTAHNCGAADRLTVCEGKPLPPGWKGKTWAMAQGIAHSEEACSELLLLTDADVAYEPNVLLSLVVKLYSDRLDLVSLMATLRVKSLWDRLLIPAFVYFFSKLYPFRWVNDHQKRKAGAAGGCILVRRNRLQQAGGLSAIADAIIDDCALGKLIKHAGGRIWLGMTQDVKSLRPYESLKSIWNMVARTAYDQLRYSPLLLASTVVGMLLVYLLPPMGTLLGVVAIVSGQKPILGAWLLSTAAAAWALMATSYLPMLKRYRLSPFLSALLPLSACLYTLMTLSSAVRFWRGRGGGWKGRTYR